MSDFSAYLRLPIVGESRNSENDGKHRFSVDDVPSPSARPTSLRNFLHKSLPGPSRKSSQEGSILLVALFVAAIGGLIVTTYVKSAILNLKNSDAQFYAISAQNLAVAGAETAVLAVNEKDWTLWTVNGNNAIRALSPMDLGNGIVGNVVVEVQDKDFTPTIISEAKIELPSGESIQEQIEVVLRPRSLFANAVTSRYWTYFYKPLKGTGVSSIDAYDSAQGSYDPFLNRIDSAGVAGDAIYTHPYTNAEIYGYAAVGHNQPLSVGSNGKVYGLDTPAGTSVDPDRMAMDFKESMSDKTDPGGGAWFSMPDGATVDLGNGATTETHRVPGDLIIASGQTLRINGKVVLIVQDDFAVFGTLEITPSGELEVLIEDDFIMTTVGQIVNQTQQPSKLRFFSIATEDWESAFWFMGAADLYALIYAPRSYVDFHGDGSGGTLYGSVVGHRVVLRGNYKLHYDEQLKGFGLDDSTFTIAQWRELGPDEFVTLTPPLFSVPSFPQIPQYYSLASEIPEVQNQILGDEPMAADGVGSSDSPNPVSPPTSS